MASAGWAGNKLRDKWVGSFRGEIRAERLIKEDLSALLCVGKVAFRHPPLGSNGTQEPKVEYPNSPALQVSQKAGAPRQ